MTFSMIMAVSACGGAGAVVRFIIDAAIKRAKSTVFPISTLIINTLAGLLFAAALVFIHRSDTTMLYTLLTTGFLGGFSTFSTAMNEIVQLARGRHWADFFVYLVLAVGLPVLAVVLGLLIFVSIQG